MLDFFYFHKILAKVSSHLYRNGIILNDYQRGNAVRSLSAELRQNLEDFEILCEKSFSCLSEGCSLGSQSVPLWIHYNAMVRASFAKLMWTILLFAHGKNVDAIVFCDYPHCFLLFFV